MLAPEIAKATVQAENVEPFDKIAAARNITVTVYYTVVTAEGLPEGPHSCEALLTKRLWRGEDGMLVKQAAANPARGTFTHVEHTGTAEGILGAYEDVLRSLTSYQAIIAARLPSPLRSDGSKWRLTTKNAPEPGALPRSQTTFHPVAGPALMSLDFDIPEALRQDCATAADLYRKVLLPARPGFAEVALLARSSVSSGAKMIGAADPLPTGCHVACIVSDGTRIEEFALALFDRIVLLGFALVEPSKCGAALKRALVDVAAAKGSERLIFEADPVLGEGVERVRRPFARYPGGILDVDTALREMALTGMERKGLKSIWADALAKAQPELKAAKEKWLEARGTEIAKKYKVEPKECRRIAEQEVARFEAGELLDDFPIHLDSGEWVTVYQILSDPERYNCVRCWSLDETASRPGVGFIQPYPSPPDPSVGKPPGPWLHSFEHGGRYWRLRSLGVAIELHKKFKLMQKEPVMTGADRDKHETNARAGHDGAASADDPNEPLDGLIERTKVDPGAPFEDAVLVALWQLSQTNFPAYVRICSQLREAGCPWSELKKKLADVGESQQARPRGKATGALSVEELTTDDFVAFMPDHHFIHLPTKMLWPAASVDARLSPVDIGLEKPVKPSLWLDRNRHCEQMTWMPGYPVLITDHVIAEAGFIPYSGNTIFNLYRPPICEPGDTAEAKPWLDHLRQIYPDDWEHIAWWCAYRVQHPEIKINHALVLGGAPGIGKDTILVPVIYAVGSWNCTGISPSAMLGRFNGHLRNVILRVNEARDLGEINSYAFYEHCKPIIASPPETLRVDEKNLREYQIPNVVGVIITTNHKTTGLYLPPDDRRHYVAWSNQPGSGEDGALPDSYFEGLYDWYNKCGLQHVAAWLSTVDVSTFNPKAPPKKTPAFWAVVNANRGGEEGDIADAIDVMAEKCERRGTQLGAFTKQQLVDAVTNPPTKDWLQSHKSLRVLPIKLERLGYTMVANPDAKDGLWRVTTTTTDYYQGQQLTDVKRRRMAVYGMTNASERDRQAAAQELAGDGGSMATARMTATGGVNER